MAEEALIEEVVEEVATEETKTQKPTLEDWQRGQEDRAKAGGWKPFDEYIESGGDPEKWRDAGAFNTYGELLGTIKRKESEFNQRLEGVHKLSQAQLAAERARLEGERDEMIEAGKLKEVKTLDAQINKLNVQQPVATDPALSEWNANNPWINEKTPKAIYARALWNDLSQSNIPVTQALMQLEVEMKKQFPAPSRTTTIPETEKGKGSGGFKAKTAVITMADLTRQEKLAYESMPGAWKDEKEFLQAVADDRKAAKGDK